MTDVLCKSHFLTYVHKHLWDCPKIVSGQLHSQKYGLNVGSRNTWIIILIWCLGNSRD